MVSRNLSAPLWFALAIDLTENLKNVDCWSAHCYALADRKTHKLTPRHLKEIVDLFKVPSKNKNIVSLHGYINIHSHPQRIEMRPFLTFLAVKTALYLSSSLTDSLTHRHHLGQARAIGHSSVNFQPITSKFCMVVHNDPLQKCSYRDFFQKGCGTYESTH